MTAIKCCPTCQRPFAPDNPFRGKRKRLLYEFLVRHPDGVTRQQILDWVWNDDPNGGPEYFGIVNTMVWQMNAVMLRRGHDGFIDSDGGPGALYRLRPASARRVKWRKLPPETWESIVADKRPTREIARAYGVVSGTINRAKRAYHSNARKDVSPCTLKP